jgi:hypothetical protein
MKRPFAKVLSAVVALALTATAAQAQSVTIGIGGGATIPTGDFKTAAKTGWHGLANIGYSLPSGLGFRGDFFYGQSSWKAGVSGKAKLTGGLANVFYEFQNAGGVKPYVIGSAGMFNTKGSASSGGFTISGSETKFTFGGGAGVKFKAGAKANVFLEGRYLSVQSSGTKTNFIPVTLGVSFAVK